MIALLALACSEQKPAPSSAPTEESPPSPRAPVEAVLEGPDQPAPGQLLELTLRVRRSTAFRAPLFVKFSVPQGLSYPAVGAKSQAGERLDPDITERVYHFHLTDLPRDDLFLSLAGQGAAAGFHARLAYRFGRAAPLPRAPLRSGPTVRLGGLDLGPAISVDAP